MPARNDQEVDESAMQVGRRDRYFFILHGKVMFVRSYWSTRNWKKR